nr:hypothetical protein [Saprospiraceae bacterium]
MEFTTAELFWTFVLLFGLLITLIAGIRIWLKRKSGNVNPAADAADFRHRERNKYQSLNVFRYTWVFLNVGFIFSVLMVLIAFNWTQYEPPSNWTTK